MTTNTAHRFDAARDEAFRDLLSAWLSFDDVRSDAGTTHAQRYAAFDQLVGAQSRMRSVSRQARPGS